MSSPGDFSPRVGLVGEKSLGEDIRGKGDSCYIDSIEFLLKTGKASKISRVVRYQKIQIFLKLIN